MVDNWRTDYISVHAHDQNAPLLSEMEFQWNENEFKLLQTFLNAVFQCGIFANSAHTGNSDSEKLHRFIFKNNFVKSFFIRTIIGKP